MKKDDKVGHWVNSIAVNLQSRHGRQKVRLEPLPDNIRGVVGVDSAPLDVVKVLEVCKPSHRNLFELQLTGSTPQEIAKTFKVSHSVIRIRFWRARAAVRRALYITRSERTG